MFPETPQLDRNALPCQQYAFAVGLPAWGQSAVTGLRRARPLHGLEIPFHRRTRRPHVAPMPRRKTAADAKGHAEGRRQRQNRSAEKRCRRTDCPAQAHAARVRKHANTRATRTPRAKMERNSARLTRTYSNFQGGDMAGVQIVPVRTEDELTTFVELPMAAFLPQKKI